MRNKYVSPIFEILSFGNETVMSLFNSAEGDDSTLLTVDFDLWNVVR